MPFLSLCARNSFPTSSSVRFSCSISFPSVVVVVDLLSAPILREVRFPLFLSLSIALLGDIGTTTTTTTSLYRTLRKVVQRLCSMERRARMFPVDHGKVGIRRGSFLVGSRLRQGSNFLGVGKKSDSF